MVAGRELNDTTNASALQMAETVMGEGVTVVGPTDTGASGSSPIYGVADTLAPGVDPGDTGVILSAFEGEMVENILRLFPDLGPATGAGHGPAARRLPRRDEGALLKEEVAA